MMDLERLAAAVGAVDVIGPAPAEVQDLAYDARAVRPGAVFFCVPGAHYDGHDFAGDAVAAGAVALVVERPLESTVPQVVVADARAAMAAAADEFFGRPTESLAVVGVTGTSGKTTTSFLLFAILAAAGRRPGLVGTIEARVGGERRGVKRTTPEAIDLQRRRMEHLCRLVRRARRPLCPANGVLTILPLNLLLADEINTLIGEIEAKRRDRDAIVGESAAESPSKLQTLDDVLASMPPPGDRLATEPRRGGDRRGSRGGPR